MKSTARPLSVIGLALLAACDVAPRPIDLERSVIETPEEGYQVFIDTVTATMIADRLAESCGAFEKNPAVESQQNEFLFRELERLSEEDPAVADGIFRRLGFPLTAEQVRNGDLEDAENFEFIIGEFFLKNAGLTVDAVGRAVGSVFRTGVDPDCEDARAEIASGSLAGAMLMPAAALPFE